MMKRIYVTALTAVFALGVAHGQLLITSAKPPRLLVQAAAVTPSALVGQISPAERQYLVAELTDTRNAFLLSIRGLTKEQWTYKATPDRWSVEECAEHLILAEPLLFADAKRMLEGPAIPRLASATSDGDHLQVAKMLDRTATAKAPAAITPSGLFATPEQAAAEFSKRRDATIAYAASTPDPLRTHGGDGPAGDTNDAYQVLLLLAAHSGRHTAQILEVEANRTYPQRKYTEVPK